jgi:hypothetical protein
MNRADLFRYELPMNNGETRVEVALTDWRGPQWILIGPWEEVDLAPLEDFLIEAARGRPYTNYWYLYDGCWGNMHRFVAKRYTWEYGPYCVGDTIEELIESIRERSYREQV